jgi:hypothetical protein
MSLFYLFNKEQLNLQFTREFLSHLYTVTTFHDHYPFQPISPYLFSPL